jgi:hypothetical protein
LDLGRRLAGQALEQGARTLLEASL